MASIVLLEDVQSHSRVSILFLKSFDSFIHYSSILIPELNYIRNRIPVKLDIDSKLRGMFEH